MDYSDCSEENGAEQEKMGLGKNAFLLVPSGEAGNMSAALWRPNKDRANKESFPVTCTPVKGTTDSVLLFSPTLLYPGGIDKRQTPSRRLVFLSLGGMGWTRVNNFDLKMSKRQRRN